MNYVYLMIFLMAVWVEIDTRINTDNVLEKIGLGLIAIGAAASMVTQNALITYGILLYFASICIKRFSRHRRAIDR